MHGGEQLQGRRSTSVFGAATVADVLHLRPVLLLLSTYRFFVRGVCDRQYRRPLMSQTIYLLRLGVVVDYLQLQ